MLADVFKSEVYLTDVPEGRLYTTVQGRRAQRFRYKGQRLTVCGSNGCLF
jgi:hypothetical protein